MLFLFYQSCQLVKMEIKSEIEEEQTIRQEGLENREQKIIDIKKHANTVHDFFNGLTKAWSPMIAVTFATECVVLISAGVAISQLNEQYENSDYLSYTHYRNIFMMIMIFYCSFFILDMSYSAELTHTCVKEFGSKVR